MSIDYKHSSNTHTQDGPRAVLPRIFSSTQPQSILDVGCGTGTWLKAASELGVSDFYGVDGVDVPAAQLLIPPKYFARHDLSQPWDLGRRFDMAFCLEVGEHLDEPHAGTLVDTLVRHSDLIYFSAACPGQQGQHHVNCQWPAYWQQLFNKRGFACHDDFRWEIWEDSRIEPWYRQNLFVAQRDAATAGREPRLRAVIHPVMWGTVTPTRKDFLSRIEGGAMPVSWYLGILPRAYIAKLARRFARA